MATTRVDGFQDRQAHLEKVKALAQESFRTGKPCPPMEERAVRPFQDPLQNVIEYTTRTREYHHPFHYRNIAVNAYCEDPANSGLEINPVNHVDGRTPPENPPPGDYIEIAEEQPIVRVVVIGSACTPPGWVAIEADPCEGFRRPDEVDELMPVRLRVDNLWGTHVRGDVWMSKAAEGTGDPLPQHFLENWPYSHVVDFPKEYVATHVDGGNYPLAGMSCAIFEIPASRKVRIMGGSMSFGWTFADCKGDDHYSFRMIRTNVLASYEASAVDSE